MTHSELLAEYLKEYSIEETAQLLYELNRKYNGDDPYQDLVEKFDQLKEMQAVYNATTVTNSSSSKDWISENMGMAA